MAKINLSKLSREELVNLQKEITTQLNKLTTVNNTFSVSILYYENPETDLCDTACVEDHIFDALNDYFRKVFKDDFITVNKVKYND